MSTLQQWAGAAVGIAQATLGPIIPALQAPLGQVAAVTDAPGREAALMEAGKAWRGIFPDPLPQRKGEPRDQARANLVRPAVLAAVAFLFGEAPGWDLPSDGETGPDLSPPEQWMQDLLTANKWQAQLIKLAINGANYGHCYWRIREADPRVGHAFWRIYPVAPETVCKVTDPDDLEIVLAYHITRRSKDAAGRETVYRQRIEREATGLPVWLIVDEHQNALAGVWVEDGRSVWEHAWPPMVDWENLPDPNQVYGLADYDATAIELNLAYNLALSSAARIVRKHGSPRPWVSGMQGLRVAWTDDGAPVDLPPEGAKIGYLAPAVDDTAGQTLRRELKGAFSEVTQTPPEVLGREDGATGDPSGEALKVRIWPMTFKTNMKRILYGAALVEMMRRLWELNGDGPDCVAVLSWPEHLIPVNPLQERQALQADLDMSVASVETVSSKLGYNYQQEQKNIAKHRAADSTARMGRIQQEQGVAQDVGAAADESAVLAMRQRMQTLGKEDRVGPKP